METRTASGPYAGSCPATAMYPSQATFETAGSPHRCLYARFSRLKPVSLPKSALYTSLASAVRPLSVQMSLLFGQI